VLRASLPTSMIATVRSLVDLPSVQRGNREEHGHNHVSLDAVAIVFDGMEFGFLSCPMRR